MRTSAPGGSLAATLQARRLLKDAPRAGERKRRPAARVARGRATRRTPAATRAMQSRESAAVRRRRRAPRSPRKAGRIALFPAEPAKRARNDANWELTLPCSSPKGGRACGAAESGWYLCTVIVLRQIIPPRRDRERVRPGLGAAAFCSRAGAGRAIAMRRSSRAVPGLSAAQRSDMDAIVRATGTGRPRLGGSSSPPERLDRAHWTAGVSGVAAGVRRCGRTGCVPRSYACLRGLKTRPFTGHAKPPRRRSTRKGLADGRRNA